MASASTAALFSVLLGAAGALLGTCGPFTDVAADAFCPFVLEIFTLGITTGTTPTTYDSAGNVSRLQMAAFLSRSVDGVLKRGGRRAALGQFWTTQDSRAADLTTLGLSPYLVACDGADLWVPAGSSTVLRVRGSDGRLLETWTGATNPGGVVVGAGHVFVAGFGNPGKLYRIEPRLAGGAVTTVATNLGANPDQIAYDGLRIWTADGFGAVSIVTPSVSLPWTVTTVTSGFLGPDGILFDGTNIWVTDYSAGKLLKLGSDGAILQTVTLGTGLSYPAFDGTNIWVPIDDSNTVAVVRASSGSILATLTGNGIVDPGSAAFDGQRVLVTERDTGNVSLWKAADLTPIGTFPIASASSDPFGACSDGVSFWITLHGGSALVRF
jgi:hypothetical protein